MDVVDKLFPLSVVTVLFRLVRPGGVRAVLAESVLLRHQLLILNRSRHPGPNLRTSDRLITGWCVIRELPMVAIETSSRDTSAFVGTNPLGD